MSGIAHVFSRRFLWSGYLIGFALGGFFDGILLHQILQWHHLLSAVEGVPDLRAHVVADGVFHAAMYVIGAVGLWMLYRARKEFTDVRADRNLVAAVLIGFGVWHVIDAVLSHWTIGIHRIRMDVPNPLAWDIGWLVLVGLPPLLAGLWMKRRYPRRARIPDRRAAGHGVAAAIAILVLVSSVLATLPPTGKAGEETLTVVLRPDVSPGTFLAALEGTEARIIWNDRAGGVWVLTRDERLAPFALYRHGALYVSGSVFPAGCSAWFDVT